MNDKNKLSLLFLGIFILSFILVPTGFAYIPEPIPPPPPPPPPEKIGVFIWCSELGSTSVINSYANALINKQGYDKIYKIQDLKNLATGKNYGDIGDFFVELDDYEGKQDTIFLYLWGHGPDEATTNPYVKIANRLKWNGEEYKYQNRFYSKYKASFQDLMSCLDLLEADRIGFLVESCYCGGFVDNFGSELYLAMSSSDWNRASYWRDGEGRFSYHFWNVLEQNSYVDAYDAWDYARDQNFWDFWWFWGLYSKESYHYQYPQYDNNLVGYAFFT